MDCEGCSLRSNRSRVVSSARMGFRDGYFEERVWVFAVQSISTYTEDVERAYLLGGIVVGGDTGGAYHTGCMNMCGWGTYPL